MNLMKKTIYSEIQKKSYDYYLLTTSKTLEEAYILYVQDGRNYLELGSFERTVRGIIETDPKWAQKLVFVLIHPGDSQERWNSYHRQGSAFAGYIRFFTEELIADVEQRLNVPVVKRGLLGDSLGGNISLNIALTNPDQWTHLLLQSAAVSEAEIKAVEELEWSLNWSIYQTVGIYEDEFISPITNTKLYLLTRNRKLFDVFKKKQANVAYTEKEEEHLWTFWQKDLTNALRFFIY